MRVRRWRSETETCPRLPGQAEEQDLSTFTQADLKALSSHQLVEFLSLLLQEVQAVPETRPHPVPWSPGALVP